MYEKLEQKLKKFCKDMDDFTNIMKFVREYLGAKVRPTGDKYIDHSINTAIKLGEMNTDCATILAGLLHHTELDDIREIVNEEVFKLVETYKKLDKVIKQTDSTYIVTTRFLLNYVKDLRPILIKLANAKANTEILKSIEDNSERKSLVKRNLNIHSKIAEYLGFSDIQRDILEQSFRITQEDDYNYISNIYKKYHINKDLLNKYDRLLRHLLSEYKNEITIQSRVKNKLSTYMKLKKYLNEGEINPTEKVKDLIGFRIITKDKDMCYKILEKIFDGGEILFEEYDDYVTIPKPNGYSAMQGPVIFKKISALPIEVQILSEEMYRCNTYGSASHFAYKEGLKRFVKSNNNYQWIEQTHLAITDYLGKKKKEFSEPIPSNIFPKEIYALTPQNRIIVLTKGDTITDFAYLVHTVIGNSMIAAKVNGIAKPLDYEVKTGDVIEIITQKGKTHPKADLLKYAKSDRTKFKIERAIKR